MIDAYSHFQLLAQHRQEVIEALKSVVAAIFSPIGAFITVPLGVAFLWLDARTRRSNFSATLPVVVRPTPPVLVSPTPTAPSVTNYPMIATAGQSERIFVNETPEYLTGLCKGRTSMEVENLPYMGKWLKLSGQLFNAASIPAHSEGLKLLSFTIHEPYYIYIGMFFTQEWSERVSILRKGSSITVIGQIEKLAADEIDLRNCELI